MRALGALWLTLAVSCTRAPAAPPPVDVEVPLEPAVAAPSPPVPEPAPATRLVSHLVDGNVYIEEVPLEPDAGAAPVAPPSTAEPGRCEAARASLDAALGATVDHRVLSAARDVERACPERAMELHDLALRLERRGMDEEATARRPLLEAAVRFEPTTRRLLSLARAADDDNDGAAAIDAARRALALTPDDALAQGELVELERRHAVEQRFDTMAAEHFTARFEGEARKELASDALGVLEEAWRGVGAAVDLHPSSSITVVFYTGAAYQDATGARDWSGGQFDGKIRVRAGSLKKGQGALRDLLFHEYLHAALATTVRGKIPAWLHEGLAQRLEPGLDRARDLAPLKGKTRAELPSLDELSHGFSRLTDRERVRLHYACALDIVDELARWRGERSFAQLFAAMNRGERFEAALEGSYGLDERLLQERWQSRY